MLSNDKTSISSKLIAQAETLGEMIEQFNHDAPTYGNAMAIICLKDVLQWLNESRNTLDKGNAK